jgi:TPR repeat protein
MIFAATSLYIIKGNELKTLARQGDAQAQYDLANRRKRINPGESIQLFEQAAIKGHAQSQLALGLLYKKGNGIGKDAIQAIQWIQKSADQGMAEAQYELGCCYQAGEGVGKDQDLAISWLTKSADQGYAQAKHMINYLTETKKRDEEQRKSKHRERRTEETQKIGRIEVNDLCFSCRRLHAWDGMTVEALLTILYNNPAKLAEVGGDASIVQVLNQVIVMGNGCARCGEKVLNWARELGLIR